MGDDGAFYKVDHLLAVVVLFMDIYVWDLQLFYIDL